MERIHYLEYEHAKRIYQKKLAEWEKDHEHLEKVREQRKKEYIENAKAKYFLNDTQEGVEQQDLSINLGEWKDDVYESPPPKEPEATEFKSTTVRKEIQKVILFIFYD